jgi:hypothetical protein
MGLEVIEMVYKHFIFEIALTNTLVGLLGLVLMGRAWYKFYWSYKAHRQRADEGYG